MSWRDFLESLEAYVLTVIEDRRQGRVAYVLRVFLHAMSLLFGTIVIIRLWLYKHRIFRPHTLGCQVISVGNLTVGGTGKTPIVETFARALQKRGRKVAILSRGYKSERPPFMERLWRKITQEQELDPPRVVSDGQNLLLDQAQSGDEPFLLANNLRDVVVIVDKNRVKSGKYAISKYGCDTLLLDDGFQYLSLQHRLDIVLVDRTNPFGNRRMLPRGVLREPIRNIKRAGYIFITKSTGDGAPVLRKQLRELNPTAEISECRHCARHLQDVYTGERKPLNFLKDLPVAAISGIAQPKGFEDELVRLGARVVYHKRYADHHRYSQQEIIDLINKGHERGGRIILTTEKDAVRFPMIDRRDLPIYFLRVEIELLSGEESFNEWVARICFA
jgi:tetraacyldisaccharide 4'-kinase